MVLTWVQRHGGADVQDADYWINRTFDRFWTAVRPDRFSLFEGLPRVLKYLQMCAATAVMDGLRAQRAMPHESLDRLFETRPGELSQPLGEGEAPFSPGQATGDAEASVVDRLAGQELWQAIVREVPDEGERTVLYCSFALGMKPAEIAAAAPGPVPRGAGRLPGQAQRPGALPAQSEHPAVRGRGARKERTAPFTRMTSPARPHSEPYS